GDAAERRLGRGHEFVATEPAGVVEQQVEAAAGYGCVDPLLGIRLTQRIDVADISLDCVVGRTEHDVYLAAIGVPAGTATRLTEGFSRVANALEERVTILVDIGDRERVTSG